MDKSNLRQNEHEQERERGNPHERLDFLRPASHEHNDHVGDKAETNAVRDGIRHRNTHDARKRRERMLNVLPIDMRHIGKHEVAHNDKRTAGSRR